MYKGHWILQKFFDFAVRELVLGYTSAIHIADRAAKMDVFKSLCLPSDVADHIVQWLEEHDSVFEQIGVDPKALELI